MTANSRTPVIKTAFGVALIGLVAFKLPTLQHYWNVCGTIYQATYTQIYDYYGGNPFSMHVYGTLVLSLLTFVMSNAWLIAIDFTEWQPLFQYKVQPKEHITVNRWLQAMARVMFNMLFVATALNVVVYYAAVWRGCTYGPEVSPYYPYGLCIWYQVPSVFRLFFEFFLFAYLHEAGFFYSHRLAHSPFFYKRIHKIHHEWTAPIGIAAQYAHPLEHVFCNLMPLMLGPLVAGSHISSFWMWYVFGLASTTISHSGYHFPLFPSPEFHDYHHLVFNQNFGSTGLLDSWHGTDKRWQASKQCQRNIRLMSLVPLTESIPEEENKKGKLVK